MINQSWDVIVIVIGGGPAWEKTAHYAIKGSGRTAAAGQRLLED